MTIAVFANLFVAFHLSAWALPGNTAIFHVTDPLVRPARPARARQPPQANGQFEMEFPAIDALPNPRLTPGALNPAVTRSTLPVTICRPKSGYTKTLRPTERYTENLKRDGIRQYNYPRQMGADAYRLREYEEDHLVPLELGGSPASPLNLWPEPHHVMGWWGSHAKDRLENRLHALVCDGRIGLAQAQREIAYNWIAAFKKYIGPTPGRQPRKRLMSYSGIAPAPVGHIVFPAAILARFANQSPGRARLRTCAAQYEINKVNHANGGLKWTQRGGGYYSLCNKRLKME